MPPTKRNNNRKKPLMELPVNALRLSSKPAKPAKPSHPTIEILPTLPVSPVPPRATDILRADTTIQQYILQLEEHSDKLEEHIQQQTVNKRKFDFENSDEFEIDPAVEDISETGEEDDEEDVPIAKRKNAKREKLGEVVPETAEEKVTYDRLFKTLRPD